VLTGQIRSHTGGSGYGWELDGEIQVERWLETAETVWTRLPG
jgi:hypothetical protein